MMMSSESRMMMSSESRMIMYPESRMVMSSDSRMVMNPESRILDLIPVDVFKSKELFHEVLKECWTQTSEEKRNEMKQKFLPSSDVVPMRDETIDLLLDGKLTMFEFDPLDRIYFNLKIWKLAPDMKQTLNEIKTLQLKAQQIREKEYQMKMWSEIRNRRKSLFKSSLSVACDDPIKSFGEPCEDWIPKSSLVLNKKESKLIRRNVNERYLKELQKLTNETEMNFLNSSDDEDVRVKIASGSKQLKSSDETRILKMMKVYKRKRKMKDSVEESASKITLEEVIDRVEGRRLDEVCLESPSIPLAVKPKVRRKSKPSPVPNKVPIPPVPIQMKATGSTVNKLTEKLRDSMGAAIFARKMDLNLKRKASESAGDVFDFDDDSPSEPLSSSSKDQTSQSSITNQVSQIISSLQGQSTTTSIPPSSQRSPTSVQPVVYDDPPASFFSLIRNVFQEHAPQDKKLTLHKLEELVKEKLKTIHPKLGWSHESVQSAMNFLSYYSEPCQTPPNAGAVSQESQDSSSSFPGSEMVPLVDYKEKNQQWQWIGGNRDGDDVMKRMSDEWNNEKDRNPSSLSDPSAPVPPPLFPTQWTVKPATAEEQRMYREQEAIRYNNPSKAFTYCVHDYEAVVGPVKGSAVINIAGNTSGSSGVNTPGSSGGNTPGSTSGTNCNTPAASVASCPSASPNKAREHSLLVNDRPPFVTLLSLVRDAAARLPNGEGTRADICELLKDSQYLLPTVSDQQVNQIVSGALDRLHYEKDPCVKYDTNRKVWIYLHRNRTENDFERLHEMQVAAAKAKRNLCKSRKPSLPKTSIASPPMVGKPGHQKGIQRPSPCKSCDSSSSSTNTPILPNPAPTPIAARIAVSPLAPKPVSIVPQKSIPIVSQKPVPIVSQKPVPIVPQTVEKTVLDILTKSQQSYQLTPTTSSFVVKKSCGSTCNQGSDQLNQVLLKPVEGSGSVQNTNHPPVVSVISVSSLTPVNRVITTSSMMVKDGKNQVNNHQKVGMMATVTRPFNSATVATVTRPFNSANVDQVVNFQPNQVPGIRVNQPIRQMLVNQPQNSVTLPAGVQSVNIPTSMILSGRPGHVVLGGKSYMMATTSGGSIVLHPQNCGPLQTGQQTTTSGQLSGVVQPLSVRTLQGIKVIPVPTQFNPSSGGNQRVTPTIAPHPISSQNASQSISQNTSQNASQNAPQNTSQNGTLASNQQFVARLIQTRPGQMAANQVIIPNNTGGYQQVILTPAPSQMVPVSKQVNQVQTPVSKQINQVLTPVSKQVNQVQTPVSKQVNQVLTPVSKQVNQVLTPVTKQVNQVQVEPVNSSSFQTVAPHTSNALNPVQNINNTQ